jgi:hypothetical protein
VRRVVVDARRKANETRRLHAGGEETVHRSWAEREPPVPSTLAALASRQSALVPSVVTAGVTLAALCLDAGERARLRVPSSLSLSECFGEILAAGNFSASFLPYYAVP